MEVCAEGANLRLSSVNDTDQVARLLLHHDVAVPEIFVEEDHGKSENARQSSQRGADDRVEAVGEGDQQGL